MARKKREDSGGAGGGEWLNTYADMVTLLLTFFIMLFSMSTIDSDKAQLLAEAMIKQFGSVPTETLIAMPSVDGKEGQASPENTDSAAIDMTAVLQALTQYIQENNLSSSVEVSGGDGYVFIRFMNDMLFEPNSAVLKPADREILRFVGNGIKSVQGQCEEISIHGFTAAVPGVDLPVNEWLLSAGRANAVLVYLDDVIGIDKEKMTATTWGMNHPIADNSTEEGRMRNRRVEIKLSTKNLLAEQLDNIYEKLVE